MITRRTLFGFALVPWAPERKGGFTQADLYRLVWVMEEYITGKLLLNGPFIDWLAVSCPGVRRTPCLMDPRAMLAWWNLYQSDYSPKAAQEQYRLQLLSDGCD